MEAYEEMGKQVGYECDDIHAAIVAAGMPLRRGVLLLQLSMTRDGTEAIVG